MRRLGLCADSSGDVIATGLIHSAAVVCSVCLKQRCLVMLICQLRAGLARLVLSGADGSRDAHDGLISKQHPTIVGFRSPLLRRHAETLA